MTFEGTQLKNLTFFAVSADLDFGTYSVQNHKNDEIEQLIEEDLVEGVQKGLRLRMKSN